MVRCFTIARALRKKFTGEIVFLAARIPTGLRSKIEADGFRVQYLDVDAGGEAIAIRRALQECGKTALVLDAFKPEFYTEDFQREIICQVERFVFIAFDNEPHYFAHVLHNQNARAPNMKFDVEPYTQCLLGLKYVVLNEDVRALSAGAKVCDLPEGRIVGLLTFGAADHLNLTCRTIRALEPAAGRFSKLIAVVGEMYLHQAELDREIQRMTIEVEVLSSISNMPEVIGECDIAFCSGGLTTWELGALGKPVIILPAGERERISANFLHEQGWAQCVADADVLSDHELSYRLIAAIRPEAAEMARRLKTEINPNGVEFLLDAILAKNEKNILPP